MPAARCPYSHPGASGFSFEALQNLNILEAQSNNQVEVQLADGSIRFLSEDVVGLGLTYKFGRAPKLPDSVEPARDVEVRAVSAAAREKREPPAVR